MMLLTPAAVGSVALVMFLANAASRRSHHYKRVSLPLDRTRSPKLVTLRAAILGNGQREVASMLGPPRIAQSGADSIWYYPLSNEERVALAISFDRGVARRVEFVAPPAQHVS
jgi:hypothetical protein